VGQNDATQQIANMYQTSLADWILHDPKSRGSYHKLRWWICGRQIRIDATRFQHRHEIAKPVGSRQEVWATAKAIRCQARDVLHQYQTQTLRLSFCLFDAIEKARSH
jgi:hypothetical protein